MNNALAAIRKQKKMSVKDICSAAEIKIQTYYKYEAGVRFPSRKVMLRIASVLEVSVGAIFFAENIDYKSNKRGAGDDKSSNRPKNFTNSVSQVL